MKHQAWWYWQLGLVWSQPLAFILFLISGFAETNRHHLTYLTRSRDCIRIRTEYSGMMMGYVTLIGRSMQT